MRSQVLAVVALMVFAGVAWLPSSAACSYAVPPSYARIHWLDGERIVTNLGWDVGVLNLRTGRFVQQADTFPPLEWALDPEGKWLVYASGDSKPNDGDRIDSCRMSTGGTFALDMDTGATIRLAEGSSRTIATNGPTVAMSHANSDGWYVYDWGAWDEVTHVSARAAKGLSMQPDSVELFGLGPHGYMMADRKSGAAVRLDPVQATVTRMNDVALDAGGGRFHAPAVSADATRFVYGTVSEDAYHDREGDHVLHVVGISDGNTEELRRMRVRDTSSESWAAQSFAWANRGLAAAMPHALYLFDNPTKAGVSRSVRSDVGLTGGVSWSADEKQLAVGYRYDADDDAVELRILDSELRTIAVHRVEADDRTVRGTSAPHDATDPSIRTGEHRPLPIAGFEWAAALAAGMMALAARRRSA